MKPKPHDIACFGAVPMPDGWQSVCPHQPIPDYGTIRWTDRALARHIRGVMDADSANPPPELP